jgi:4-diphosphocytidyl-2-C-methyl-D-erythritol kinase
MMREVVRSYAKINWALRILGRRPDGYHDLETLFQQISLYDVLTIEPADTLSLTCNDASIPVDDSNLIIRAAHAIGAPPVAIHMEKQIPAGGGLGGGSSNAAATLLALDRMFEMKTTPERMHEIAAELGSDVPFFLVGATAYATGRGEILTRLEHVAHVPLVLILPEERVITKDAFDGVTSYSEPVGIERFRQAIGHDLFSEPSLLVNDFEASVFPRLPQLARWRQQLLDAGALWAGMTGSGSTIVGAFSSLGDRNAALAGITGVNAVAAESM